MRRTFRPSAPKAKAYRVVVTYSDNRPFAPTGTRTETLAGEYRTQPEAMRAAHEAVNLPGVMSAQPRPIY